MARLLRLVGKPEPPTPAREIEVRRMIVAALADAARANLARLIDETRDLDALVKASGVGQRQQAPLAHMRRALALLDHVRAGVRP